MTIFLFDFSLSLVFVCLDFLDSPTHHHLFSTTMSDFLPLHHTSSTRSLMTLPVTRSYPPTLHSGCKGTFTDLTSSIPYHFATSDFTPSSKNILPLSNGCDPLPSFQLVYAAILNNNLALSMGFARRFLIDLHVVGTWDPLSNLIPTHLIASGRPQGRISIVHTHNRDIEAATMSSCYPELINSEILCSEKQNRSTFF